MWVPLQRDSRGIESKLATNYLGQYHLVLRLWPALKKANGARVINVSSYGHQMAPFNFDNPNFAHREYQTLQAYGQSKTTSNLFALELDNRAKSFNVQAYSPHPGLQVRSWPGIRMWNCLSRLGFLDDNGIRKSAGLKTIPQGAATTVWCATSPLLNDIGGVYCEDADIAELDLGNFRKDSGLETHGVQPYSLDEVNAKKLWDLSEKMTGIAFEVI